MRRIIIRTWWIGVFVLLSLSSAIEIAVSMEIDKNDERYCKLNQEEQRQLSSVTKCNESIAKQVLQFSGMSDIIGIAGIDTDVTISFQEVFCKTISKVFPIRLYIGHIENILKTLYPKGVFADFTFRDSVFISRLFLTESNTTRHRGSDSIHTLRCIIGSCKSMIDNLKLKVSDEDVESFLFRNIDLPIMGKNSIQSSIEMDTSKCVRVIEALFPNRMFHNYTNVEILFIAHLCPQKSWWSHLNKESIDLLTECLIGVMRTLAIRDYNSDASYREHVKSYLDSSLLENSVSKIEYPSNGVFSSEDECNAFMSNVICAVYGSEGFATKPGLLTNFLDGKTIQTLKDAFNSEESGVNISVDANIAIDVWSSLAPRGMFHLFTKAEIMLVNLMYPAGLKENQKLAWMEWLAGSYRSRLLSACIKNPLSFLEDTVVAVSHPKMPSEVARKSTRRFNYDCVAHIE